MAHEFDRQLLEAIHWFSDRWVLAGRDAMLDCGGAAFLDECMWSGLGTEQSAAHVDDCSHDRREM